MHIYLIVAKLSSSGSDSEREDIHTGFETYDYNSINQDIGPGAGGSGVAPESMVGDDNAQDATYAAEDDIEAGENFDPTAFFQSFAPNQDYQHTEDSNPPPTTIDHDLQVQAYSIIISIITRIEKWYVLSILIYWIGTDILYKIIPCLQLNSSWLQ